MDSPALTELDTDDEESGLGNDKRLQLEQPARPNPRLEQPRLKRPRLAQPEPPASANETDWDRQRRKRVGIMEVLRRLPAYEMLERARLMEIDAPVPPHLMNDPDPCEPCSKRRWETRFHTFKSQLHEWFDDQGLQGLADAQQSVVPENRVICTDPRHYALSVVCPLAGVYCSCLSKKSHAVICGPAC